MRMNNDGKIFFEVGDRVKPRLVIKPGEDGRPTKMPHPKATGGIRFETKAGRAHVVEQGLPDTVAFVDEFSLQIQLASWVPDDGGSIGSLRGRWESPEHYEAVDPENAAVAVTETGASLVGQSVAFVPGEKSKSKRGGTGAPTAT